MRPEREPNEGGHAHKTKNRRYHQTSSPPHHEPEQGAKDLTAVQGIDGKHIENQQHHIDYQDSSHQPG
jgi:hypothetical protein